METITNAVSAATNAASNLIYGDQTKADEAVETTKNNETAGKEPISGVEGKGTKSDPFDQGNDSAAPLATANDKTTFLDYKNNETGGKEPISGAQGLGTAKEPFDQGNDGKATVMDKSTGSEPFLKLDPDTKPMTDSPAGGPTGGDPKIYSDTPDATYTGMKIVPLNPDAKTSNTGATPASTTTETTGTTGITDKAGVSDQVWKDTPIDDISRSGAPGSGPKGPAHVTPAAPDSTATTSTTTADSAIKTSAPDTVTASSDKYARSSSLTNPTDSLRDTPEWTSTGVSPSGGEHLDAAKKAEAATKTTDPSSSTTTTGDSKTGIAEDKTARKSESGKSPELSTTTSNDEKSGKMSHLKEKMKNKLHIGSKDK
jgi:hypothetical protein